MTPLDFKLWRISRGLTQRQAAELFGVKQQNISDWELFGPPARVMNPVPFADKFAQVEKQLEEVANVSRDW